MARSLTQVGLAEFCYAYTGTAGDGQVLDPDSLICNTVEFTYPDEDGLVAYEPCFCG